MKRILSGTIMAIVLTFVLSACSVGYQPSPLVAPSMDNSASAPDMEFGVVTDAMDANGYMSSLPLISPTNIEGKKMVYSVELALQTTDFENGTRNLLATVDKVGGYLKNANLHGHSLYKPDLERYAIYTFGIPSEQLAGFLVTMEEDYNLWQLKQEAQDITAQYRQTSTRLADLMEQEARLLLSIKEASGDSQKRTLERELSVVQEEISRLSASKGSMESSVIYSTVSIKLYEVDEKDIVVASEDGFTAKLSKAANKSLVGFISFWQSILIFLVMMLPTIIVLVVCAGVTLLAIRLIKKKGKKIDDQKP